MDDSGTTSVPLATMREDRLTRLWCDGYLIDKKMVSRDGHMVKIVYRGRPGVGRGPDIREAVLSVDETGLVTGDVEVHVRASHWRRHGHHLDAAYNGVVLHLVLFADDTEPVRRQDGTTLRQVSVSEIIPVLADDEKSRGRAGTDGEPCRSLPGYMASDEVLRRLDEAGKSRFEEKSSRLLMDLVDADADQILYQALMQALGYSQNKAPFLELARLVPLHVLDDRMEGETDESTELILRTVLIGSAGLLDRHMGNGSFQREIELWRSMKLERQMDQDRWRLASLRPVNRPERRLMGMAHLLVRFRHRGLVAGLTEDINRGVAALSRTELENRLLVDSYDDKGAFIGAGRAGEMAVNVVLPFLSALGEHERAEEKRKAARRLYGVWPKLGNNALLRQMSRQLWDGRRYAMIDSARRQQGLLHIYKRFCTQGRCSECPLLAW
jgi:hypothetical protein